MSNKKQDFISVDKYGIYISINIEYLQDTLNTMVCRERAMVILEAGARNSTINSAKKSPNEEVHPITRNTTMKLPVSEKKFCVIQW